MRKYWFILRAGFMSILAYRANVFLNSFSNIAYIVLIYFLWRAIYQDAGPIINGLRFEQAFLYLAFASTIFNIFKTWTEWAISSQIISGNILKDITKPFNFQFKTLFESTARAVFNAVLIGFPVAAAAFFVSGESLQGQLIYSLIALILAYIINFQLDFIVGITAFYTHSIWGISLTKETFVLMLSGAIVPMAFFPASMGALLMYTPFPYIYHAPLSVLMGPVSDSSAFQVIFCQIGWIAFIYFISKIYYAKALKQVTVHGG